ncbi:hypothetical protein [Urbifossiella limnaea]|uniref:Uncharacterized protein n=1 Tax=Urbifossiella limnaea TaxID=2528023 RepID=A0A517Y0M1_9BACT|nr:hypothetical protein [Urbifossiella limnaea]QDU23303.1 hypothetical protein ETAA1_52980 [Urbifossiella limnaea]
MKVESLEGELRAVAERLFRVVEEVTGSPPVPSGADRYKAAVPGRDAVYMSFIVRGGSKNPPQSVWLHTGWSDHLAGDLVQRGDNWYGGDRVSAELTARASEPDEVAQAEEFLHRAL